MSDLDNLVTRAQAATMRAYKLGSVPVKPEYPYAVLALSRLAPDVRTLDGSGNTAHRFTVQIFGRTSDALEDIADKMLAAFDAASLTEFDGDPQCRAEVTTPPYRDPDDRGVLAVTQTYRF